MNIEELFDNELYHSYGLLTTDDANILINYLKEEVMEYVEGLQKRIVELEADKRELIKSLEWLYEVSEIPHDKDYGAATNAATGIVKHGREA